MNRLLALKIGLTPFEGAVTKVVGNNSVRVVPHRNFDPMNNIEDAREVFEKLFDKPESDKAGATEEHF
jgi:hypothetical protein